MEQIGEEEQLLDLLDSVGFTDDESVFVDDLIDIEKSEKKTLEFFFMDSSDSFAVFTFTRRDKVIFQLYDIKTKDSSFSYIRDEKMVKSHLLNVINRRSQRKGAIK